MEWSTVSEALARIFETTGLPIALIKDGGTDLKKGVEMFCEQRPQHKILAKCAFMV